MKIISATVLMFCLMGSLALGQASISSTGHPHNFSGNTWANNEICLPCHTPHNAKTTVSDAPLWNHEVTATSFTLYTGYDLNATMGQPNSSSLLCLSCHDGTVALENFGTTTTGTTFISGTANLGTTLADDHPIGFVYNTALATADGELYDPATTTAVANLLTGSGRLECSSCHDAHDNSHGSLLVMDNTDSDLCLTCHDK